jgi:hypothetical protein
MNEKNMKFELNCIDVFGKTHPVVLEGLPRGSGMSRPIESARHGIRVKFYR